MTEPITTAELKRMLEDPEVPERELRRYLQVDERNSGPFNPVLEPNPKTVVEDEFEAAGLLNALNAASRLRRRHRYERKIAKGWDGIRVVSEGDSWFQYPILLDDVIDQLSDRYAIRSLGAAGDLLADMLKKDELGSAIEEESPHVLLISGGGNDMVHDGRLATMLHAGEGRPPEAYPKPEFEHFLAEIEGLYRDLFQRMADGFPKLKVVAHGYDRAIPKHGKWLGKPMESIDIQDRALQRAIIAVLIDRFNQRLADASQNFPNVLYCDCRGVVADAQWHDELHPKDPGYAAVAARFKDVIEAALPGDAS